VNGQLTREEETNSEHDLNTATRNKREGRLERGRGVDISRWKGKGKGKERVRMVGLRSVVM
jgi:hypothetical protein